MKILVSIAPHGIWALPDAEVERLRCAVPDATVVNAPSHAGRLRELPGTDVAFLLRITPDEFAAADRLRWIQSPAAGVGGVLVPALRDSQVLVSNARGIHGESIAEHVVAVTIVLFRQIHRALRCQASRQWGQDILPLTEYRTIGGRTMGIVGLGAIGSAIAAKAAALGMRVVACRRHVDAPHPPAVSAVHPPAGLPGLLEESDVVVLAAPLTGQTAGLIGAPELRRMRPGAVLVNIARGKLVREAELVEALASGTIAGAALDVFEHEPLDPASPLWDLPNVVLTPHTSGFRGDYWGAAIDLFVENLARWRRGEPLLNVVDKQAGY